MQDKILKDMNAGSSVCIPCVDTHAVELQKFRDMNR